MDRVGQGVSVSGEAELLARAQGGGLHHFTSVLHLRYFTPVSTCAWMCCVGERVDPVVLPTEHPTRRRNAVGVEKGGPLVV